MLPVSHWQLATGKQDVMQTAYQIEVADSEKMLQTGAGLVMEQWSCGVRPVGAGEICRGAFGVGTEIYWRVTVWTNTGDKAQSNVRHWSMSLLDSSDWKAGWIGLNDSTNLKLDGERPSFRHVICGRSLICRHSRSVQSFMFRE